MSETEKVMVNVQLKQIVGKKIDLYNSPFDTGTKQLGIGVSYSVEPNDEKKRCTAEIKIVVRPEEEGDKSFSIEIELIGFFEIVGEYDNDEELREETYRFMFPQAQTYISAITAISGLSSLIIPDAPRE